MTAYSGLLIAETLGLNHRTVDNILSCFFPLVFFVVRLPSQVNMRNENVIIPIPE
jgi:hypothetical protein